jgi:hypothetical protein
MMNILMHEIIKKQIYEYNKNIIIIIVKKFTEELFYYIDYSI